MPPTGQIRCSSRPLQARRSVRMSALTAARNGNHYDALSVPTSASQATIKQAYIKLCQELHPDRHRNESQSARHRIQAEFVKLHGVFQVHSEQSGQHCRCLRWIFLLVRWKKMMMAGLFDVLLLRGKFWGAQHNGNV
eukprot:m.140374 g.140374  ORF g.140374 m.140374 type:complete len:137 (+) comp52568_c2_seq46:210-620(+)